MNLLSRRYFFGLVASSSAAALLVSEVVAREPEVFQSKGLSIGGIDPIGYFDLSRPVSGRVEHEVRWNGALWRFASADAALRFAEAPERYAPEFGGYCAFAASRGYLAPTIPEAWTVSEGRLYLNASLRARELWLRDVPGNIAKGRSNWPGILG